ncbi:MAG: hypothetical protein IJC43_08605 [Clostridia bacterium]|nr:hypothetical protein [Clostridia bacterium]
MTIEQYLEKLLEERALQVKISYAWSFVESGTVTVKQAATSLHLTEDEFLKKVKVLERQRQDR